jgi:hypothetical protein
MRAPARRIEQAAADFWVQAGGRREYGRPVDLERAIAYSLPLAVCRMPALSVVKIGEVLKRIGTVPWTHTADRPLRACLIADLGVGLVFLDGADPPDEQRYSLAHEVAHFLLHYLKPRLAAVETLGGRIVEILDRRRPPTTAERLSSALAAVPLEPFRHAMGRSPDGQPSHHRTYGMEAEADDLALELLVPLVELRSLRDTTAADFAANYGIPIWAADLLAAERKIAPATIGVISLFKNDQE